MHWLRLKFALYYKAKQFFAEAFKKYDNIWEKLKETNSLSASLQT